jgi:tetratricopeptide (TPR) repeat protein
MLAYTLKILFRLFWRPAAAMGEILDRGSLLWACVAVLAVSLLVQASVVPVLLRAQAEAESAAAAKPGAVPPEDAVLPLPHAQTHAHPGFPFRFYTPLLLLAVFYVPGVLLLSNLIVRQGGFGTVFRRDYSPLLTCASLAWAAANIPLVLAAWLAPLAVFGAVAVASYLYFAVLMFFAVRTVSGAGNAAAAGVVCLSAIPAAVGLGVAESLVSMLGWAASPFFLLFAYYYLGGELRNLGTGLRSRQNFRRMLEAATLNPHDAGAQYQLGLICQQRRQYTEAIQRFKNAVAIDPGETDAHFQLGRIARDQGRLKDALESFQMVLNQDERHSSNETLREIGEVYCAAGQYQDARRELAEYVERRPYDPEGLYYCGLALEHAGDAAGAREMYARAMEAARTAPHYRRHIVARWSRQAQKQARRLGRGN